MWGFDLSILIDVQVRDVQLFLLGQTFSVQGCVFTEKKKKKPALQLSLYINTKRVCVSLYKDVVRQPDISGHDEAKW